MEYEFYWPILLEYRHLLIQGLVVTVQLSALGFVFSLILGILVGVARTSQHPLLRFLAAVYVQIFRNIPLVVQLFYWYFVVGLGSFTAGLVGLVLYSAAFIGEVIRSGIQSIPKTQYEAAYSSGLSTLQVIRYIILPQALMIVIPPLGTELVIVVKNSALAMVIAVQELTFMTQEIDAITFRGFEAATAATVIYVLLNSVIVGTLAVIERVVKIEIKVL